MNRKWPRMEIEFQPQIRGPHLELGKSWETLFQEVWKTANEVDLKI